jgi:hypothetical protein
MDLSCHPKTSDNVRQQPPIEGGVFGGISNELKSKSPRILDVFSPITVPSRGASYYQSLLSDTFDAGSVKRLYFQRFHRISRC